MHLSDWLEVEICHEGKVYRQRYERGKVVYKLKVVGECEARTRQEQRSHSCRMERFLKTTVFDYNILKQRFREMAFLTKGTEDRSSR